MCHSVIKLFLFCKSKSNYIIMYTISKIKSKMRLLSIARVPTITIKLFMVIVAMLSIYLSFSYIILEVWYMWLKKINMKQVLVLELPFVVVHIDLKGTPLKLSYLENLLPVLKNHGVNGLLMEYEDMFPYEGALANLSAKNCYKKAELQKFLSSAYSAGFEVIPLVQTFGHLEYALKLKDFKDLRETPLYPDSICPSKVESEYFLTDLLEQILYFHEDIAPTKYIHIGCDEVYHINECENCKIRKLSTKTLFLRHVNALSIILKSFQKDITVLIWDDMLRGIKPAQWNTITSFKNVQVVYWDYKPNLEVSHLNLFKYHKKFPHIWIATAYKGADGRTATLTDTKSRFYNHFAWLNVLLGYKFGGDQKVYNFKGIILTGWSRYSHMEPPCELLPASIPSLILNLLAIEKFKTGITDLIDEDIDETVLFEKDLNTKVKKSINCFLDPKEFDSPNCSFDGRDLKAILKQYVKLEKDISYSLNNNNTVLGSVEYYAKLNLLNMHLVKHYIQQCKKNMDKLKDIEKLMTKEMSKYYEAEFVTEYVNFKVLKHKTTILHLLNILRDYMKVKIWNRGGKSDIFNLTEKFG